jgi:hypothetical protein
MSRFICQRPVRRDGVLHPTGGDIVIEHEGQAARLLFLGAIVRPPADEPVVDVKPVKAKETPSPASDVAAQPGASNPGAGSEPVQPASGNSPSAASEINPLSPANSAPDQDRDGIPDAKDRDADGDGKFESRPKVDGKVAEPAKPASEKPKATPAKNPKAK